MGNIRTHYMNAKELEKRINEWFPPSSHRNTLKYIIDSSFFDGFIYLDQVENNMRILTTDNLNYLLGNEMPFDRYNYDYSKDKLFKYLTTAFEGNTPNSWMLKWETWADSLKDTLKLFVTISSENKGYKLDDFPYDLVHSQIEKEKHQSALKYARACIYWGAPLQDNELIVYKNTGQCKCFNGVEKIQTLYNKEVAPLMLEKIMAMFPEFIANQQMMTMPSW